MGRIPRPLLRGLILVTALGFLALEYGLGRLVHRETHDWRESAATLGVAIVQNLVRLVEVGIIAIPFAFVCQHRLFDFSAASAPALLGLFLGSEFLYYWQHRASHRIRWMWATHRVHHSPTQVQPDRGYPARLDRQYFRQLPVLPAAGLDRFILSPSSRCSAST